MSQLNPPVLPPNNPSPPGRPLKPYRSRRIQPMKDHGEQPPKREPHDSPLQDDDENDHHIDIEV
jgi:hypothetical protein